MKKYIFFFLVSIFITNNLNSQAVEFEQYKLDNGLTVILHKDNSAPVINTTLMFHVGAKNEENDKKLQEIYDFNFRQLELSIREIGYGDQSINKKMKDYINVFHGIISEIHFWDKLGTDKKKEILSKFLQNFDNIGYLIDYFEEFNEHLSKINLNSYLKSVNTR